MGTRANIGILCDDGKVAGLYLHWDGYVEHAGHILYNSYRDVEKVIRLIQGGNISSLDHEVAPEDVMLPLQRKHDKNLFNTPQPPFTGHSFDDPAKGVTVFYGRDRGEKDQGPVIYDSPEDFRNHMEEYAYLFNPKTCEWTWCKSYGDYCKNKWYTLKPSQWKNKEVG